MVTQAFFVGGGHFPLQQTRDPNKKGLQHVWLGAVFPNDTKGKVLRPFKKYITFSVQSKIFGQKLKQSGIPIIFMDFLKPENELGFLLQTLKIEAFFPVLPLEGGKLAYIFFTGDPVGYFFKFLEIGIHPVGCNPF